MKDQMDNLIFPLSIEHKSEIKADDVGPGPAPSPL